MKNWVVDVFGKGNLEKWVSILHTNAMNVAMRVVVRKIMNVSSSWDHRVVDGADGASLIQDLKKMLEHPSLIFM